MFDKIDRKERERADSHDDEMETDEDKRAYKRKQQYNKKDLEYQELQKINLNTKDM